MVQEQARIAFVTYADGVFEQNIEANLAAARQHMRAYQTFAFTRRDLEASDIYPAHQDVFAAPRGRGYWAWKPWAILQAFKACQPGDVVIYQDCGFGPRYRAFMRPQRLVQLAQAHGFLAGVARPDYGPNRLWIHKRCLEIVADDSPRYAEASMIEATLSLWEVNERSRRFLDTWLGFCLNLEAIRDIRPDERADQVPDFIEHRHDQAILTILAIREDAAVIEPSPQARTFAKSLSMLELDERAKRGGLPSRAILRCFAAVLNLRRRFKSLFN